MKNIVIIGATSSLAQAFARRYPAASFVLVGRSLERLDVVASDLRARGATVETKAVQTVTLEGCRELLRDVRARLNGIDLVLIAQGVLIYADEEEARIQEVFQVNVIDVTQWMYATLELFKEQTRGKLAIFSSVAADRGRATNAIYGASKAAISTLIEGLRQRYASTSDIAIYDIKPGPIDTPMTERMKKTPLFSTADRVAKDVETILERHPKGGVFYTPGWWRFIMWAVRSLPEFIFFRLKF